MPYISSTGIDNTQWISLTHVPSEFYILLASLIPHEWCLMIAGRFICQDDYAVYVIKYAHPLLCNILVWSFTSSWDLPSNLQYRSHLSWQSNDWSLRYSWSIAYRHCSNNIFILELTSDFNRLGTDNCMMRLEPFKSYDLVRLILDDRRYTYLPLLLMAGILALVWSHNSH